MAAKSLSLLVTLKLPDGVLIENLEGIEVKVTTKEGEELTGQRQLTFDHESETLCVELTTTRLSQEQRTKENMCNEDSTYRRVGASATPNKLPMQLSKPHALNFQFDQLKHPINEAQQLAERMLTLTVPSKDDHDIEYHSLPESRVTHPMDISRPHSDTDITTLPFQTQDDVTSNRRISLHFKGDERLILEEPVHEGLSFNIDDEVESVDYTEHHEEETCDPLPLLSFQKTHPLFYIPSSLDSPTTPIAEASSFLMMDGPTQAESTPGLSRNVIGSGVDLSFYLKSEYYGHTTVFQSEAVFPSQKPYVSTGGDEYPDVFVEYSDEAESADMHSSVVKSRPTIWPVCQYTENPMRYDVGRLPKKSMNSVYYSLDESFAFKEERHKNLLINKKDVFQRVVHLDPNKFVPIIAYLHDGCASRVPTVGYQIMEYYKDGSIHDVFKVEVNRVQCNCFLDIYHEKYKEYTQIKNKRDLYRTPYRFHSPLDYHQILSELEKQLGFVSIQLENLVRNFCAIVIQMLEAVMSLHSHNLIHRDIKPHNFLVKRLESCHCPQLIFCSCEQPGFQVLLGDYDFVTFATNLPWDFSRTKFDYSSTTKRGTVGYRPIELNFDNEGAEICDPKSDVYSLGVSILEILAGLNWSKCDEEIEDMLTVCLQPLLKKSEQSFSVQQYQEELTEKYIDLEVKNTELMKKGIDFEELSEINQIIASVCTTIPTADIKETVKQVNYLAVKRYDGIRTVLSLAIKARHVSDRCAGHSWKVHEAKWICEIIQQCIRIYPQKRPHVQQLLIK